MLLCVALARLLCVALGRLLCVALARLLCVALGRLFVKSLSVKPLVLIGGGRGARCGCVGADCSSAGHVVSENLQ